MKVWIRRLALIMSLVMLAAACGMAEEIEIDGGQAGEIAPEGAADPEGVDTEDIELEGIELEDMGLEVGGERGHGPGHRPAGPGGAGRGGGRRAL